METTEGTLLGGRVRYRQPREGYRTGIEPVLLAASVPARAGERVIEAGLGAGAGLMCLAARVPGIEAVGIEIDPAMAELARANIEANGFAGLSVVIGDVTQVELPAADHVMANPPWHDPGSTGSPVGRRRLAKQEGARGVESWVAALGGALRPGGTLTMIMPPGLLARATAACEGALLSGMVRYALLPKAGRPAKLVLLRAVLTLPPPGPIPVGEAAERVLHEADGAYTPAIEAVLRHGAALVMGERRAACLGRTA